MRLLLHLIKKKKNSFSMKRLVPILITMNFLSCSSPLGFGEVGLLSGDHRPTYRCSMPPYLSEAELRKVNFEITTIFSVRCNDFEVFGDQVAFSVIESENTLKLLTDNLTGLELDPTGYVPDVRAKLLMFYSDGKVDTLCMSDLGIVYKGQSYKMNEKIKSFVNQN